MANRLKLAAAAESKKAEAEATPAAPPAKLNKSELMRDALRLHPDKGVSEIAEILTKETGVTFTAAMVSQIKSKSKKGNSTSAGKKAKDKPAAKKSAPRSIGIDEPGVFDLDAASRFVQAAGSIERAKRFLDQLAGMRGLLG